jgi:predicted acylesterase/phospholipase RssA
MLYDLVFEGGGAKGLVFIGALEELEKRGYKPGRLLGTSAGAITAMLVAIGYDSKEMREALNEKINGEPVFSTFLEIPESFQISEIEESMILQFLHKIDLPFLWEAAENKLDQFLMKELLERKIFRQLFSFVELGGLFSANNFLDWLCNKMDSGFFEGKKRDFSKMTFAELFQATGSHLSMVVADTTSGRMLVLNHQTSPMCSVAWGVRMSMSIPLLWQEVIWKSEWGNYLGRDISGHTLVDGGTISNFPIELFIDTKPRTLEIMGDNVGNDILGMLIDETLPVDGVDDEGKGGWFMDLPISRRFAGLIDTVMGAHDKKLIDGFKRYIIHLPAKGFGTTEFNMSPQKQSLLINAGIKAVRTHFEELVPSIESYELHSERDLELASEIASNILEK